MIEEQAQVIEIKDGQLLLQAQTQTACGACEASKGCGTSLLSKVVGRKFTHFQAENNVDAKVGDTVVVGLAEDALLKGSLVMYLIPILGMLLFALAADFLVAEVASRDLYITAAGLSGLVFGSFLAKSYFSHHQETRQFSPTVLRKIIR